MKIPLLMKGASPAAVPKNLSQHEAKQWSQVNLQPVQQINKDSLLTGPAACAVVDCAACLPQAGTDRGPEQGAVRWP